MASNTMDFSLSSKALNMNAYDSLVNIFYLVSSDFGTIFGVKSLFLFQFPNASALTEFLGPFDLAGALG